MRYAILSLGFGLGLLACAGASDPAPRDEIVDLDGHAVPMDATGTTESGGVTSTHATVDGRPIEVAFDGKELRVTFDARTLVLAERSTQSVHAELDDAAHGEHGIFDVPSVALYDEDALAAARGHVGRRVTERYGVLVPAAAHAIATWSGASRKAAENVLASWIASLPKTDVETTGVTPKYIEAFDLESGESCSQGTSCSQSVGGYSCSVSCSQGWSPGWGQNCAHCGLWQGASGSVYGSCTCDW